MSAHDTRGTLSTRARILGASFLALAAAAAIFACAGTPDTGAGAVTHIYISPNAYPDFHGSFDGGPNRGVQGFLATKCGSLDCHGAIGRPFRVFSQYGLRQVDDAGDIPGGAPTSDSEIYANYASAIGVQPELTSKVFYGLVDPHALLLLRKPLNLERHKGGQVLQGSDNGDICLSTWLQDGLIDQSGTPITLDNNACNTAAQLP
jgi:hypothetical protein